MYVRVCVFICLWLLFTVEIKTNTYKANTSQPIYNLYSEEKKRSSPANADGMGPIPG